VAFEEVIANIRREIILALDPDECQKFAFPDVSPNASVNLWFIRLESARFTAPHRMNQPPTKLECVANWIVECFLFQAPADRTTESDSYVSALSRAESATFALYAVGDTLGLSAVSVTVLRTDTGYLARVTFQTQWETDNA
jgi:hypothetical protein